MITNIETPDDYSGHIVRCAIGLAIDSTLFKQIVGRIDKLSYPLSQKELYELAEKLISASKGENTNAE